MKSRFFPFIALLLIGSFACGGTGFLPVTGGQDTPSPETENLNSTSLPESMEATASTTVATVLNIRTQVYIGEPNSLRLIDGETELGNDESVKVEDGGKARLTFPGPVNLLLYNQTEIDDVKMEFDENSNPRIVNDLIRGGFSGHVESGTHYTINLAFGVKVNILGTSFFIMYDDINGYLTIGKFDGTLIVSIPSLGDISVNDEEMIDINSEGKLIYHSSIPFTVSQFDAAADQCFYPLQGFNILRKTNSIPQPGKSTFEANVELACQPMNPLTITPTFACETPSGIVQAKVVILRDGPDLRYLSVGQHKRNEEFTVWGRYKDWYQVEFPNGHKGWLYKDWITISPGEETKHICDISYQGSPPTPRPPKCNTTFCP